MTDYVEANRTYFARMSDGPSILTGSRTYMTYVFLMWAGLYFDVTESWVADAFELFDEDGDGTVSQVVVLPSHANPPCICCLLMTQERLSVGALCCMST